MKYPFYCKECGYKITYKYEYNGIAQCFECGKPFPEEKKKVESTAVVTNKGGKRITRSN